MSKTELPDGADSAGQNETKWVALCALVVLIAAGVAGNFFRFPIFLNVDFLFGSIFALLILQCFGLGRGILAAALISSYTFILWNHPYACVILTAEVVVVGWLFPRRKIGLVLADTLYWLCIGMPLVFLFYYGVMDVPLQSAAIVMIKQAVNGIANALVARLLFALYTLRSRTQLLPFREIVSSLLLFFVLCPALILLAVNSREDFTSSDQHIRNTLIHDRAALSESLNEWLSHRKDTIATLANLASTLTPRQIQPRLEQARASDTNFLRIGLLDQSATTVAYTPLVDALGQATIGKNFADRPFIPLLKESLRPMLTEVVMARVGPPKPSAYLLVPVLKDAAYAGYIVGVLDLAHLESLLTANATRDGQHFIILDRNGRIIVTNDPAQKVMAPLLRGSGSLEHFEQGIDQWLPSLPANTPIMERWKKSYYVAQASIGELSEWTLILEQPVAPFQKELYDLYTRKLAGLFLLLLAALLFAEVLSRLITRSNEELQNLTSDLPRKLAENEPILWPSSAILETKHLIENFRQMAASLSTQFSDIRQINASLESRVAARTRQLLESRERFALATLGSQDGIWDWNIQTGEVYFSGRWFEILGYEAGALPQTFATFESLIHPDDLELVHERIRQHLEEQALYSIEFRMLRKDGDYGWILARGQALWDEEGDAVRMAGSHTDIRERKEAEEVLLAHIRISDYSFSHSLDELLTKTLDEVESLTGSSIGFFHFLEADQTTLSLQVWSSNTLSKMCTAEGKGEHYPVAKAGVWADSVRSGTPLIHNHYEGLPERKGLPPGHAPIKRELVVPVFRNNLIVAIIGVGNRQTNYTSRDIEKVEQLASLAWEIVERKRAEQRLADQAGFLNTLLDTVPLPIFYKDMDGRYLGANESFQRCLGKPLDEVIGRTAQDIYSEELLQVNLEADRALLKDGGMRQYESPVVVADGRRRDFLVYKAAFQRADNTLGGLIGALVDITELKRQQEMALLVAEGISSRVGEDFFRSLTQSLAKLLDTGHVFVGELVGESEVNVIAGVLNGEEITSMSYDLAGTPCADVFASTEICIYADGVQESFPEDLPLQSMGIAGYAGSALCNTDGKPIGIIVVLFNQAISAPALVESLLQIFAARAASELERRQIEKVILESKARYKKLFQEFETIINGIPDSLTLWSSEMRLVWANKGALEQFGLTLPELVGKECREICYACKGQRLGCEVLRCFRSQSIENRLLTDAEGRTWGVKAFPLLNDSGVVTQVIRLASDLTERMHLREEAARSAHLAALGELAAGVAHEINNPTGLILLEMPILRDAFHSAAPILEEYYRTFGDFPFAGMNYTGMRGQIGPMIDEIEEGAQRIKRIVEELKDFSRPVEGNPFVPVDLNEVVRKASNLLSGRIKKMTDAFSVEYAPEAVLVAGNFQKIEQVIINLIVNACQSLAQRSAAVTVKISVVMPRGFAIVTIRDEGVGIRPEHLPLITDPFFTTRREVGGTGLGLSVSMRIIEEHHGTLRYDSTPGKGTLAILELPLFEEESR